MGGMQRKALYPSLLVIGTFGPITVLIPWLVVHGFDLRLFIAELFANRISTFFAVDLLISACVVVVFALTARPHTQRLWLVIVLLLCVGVSAALPLLLYLREKAAEIAPDRGSS